MDDHLSIDMSVSVEPGKSMVVSVGGVNLLITALPAASPLAEEEANPPAVPPELPPLQPPIELPPSSIALMQMGVLEEEPIYVLPADDWVALTRSGALIGKDTAYQARFHIADVAEVEVSPTSVEVSDLKAVQGGFGDTLE